jgi:hypothetical protein
VFEQRTGPKRGGRKAAAMSTLAAMVAPAYAVASQGPGVGAGTASGLAQGCAAAIVGALGMVAVIGVVRYFFGWSPLPEK